MIAKSTRPLNLALFGTAPDTGNLGVSALSYSVIAAIAKRAQASHLTVFDHGSGWREDRLVVQGDEFRFSRCGLRNSRRYYRRESLRNVEVSAALRLAGNPAAATFLNADAVLDITGGDSFTDLYGMRRFRGSAQEKRLALRHSGGLILLPQTYGPYQSDEARRVARDLISRASLAIARDEDSLARMRELLQDRFDANRHILGVDVAFALPSERPPDDETLASLSRVLDDRETVIGFNVSGLCLNDPAAPARFGFRADYTVCVIESLRAILRESEATLLLVPHVVVPENNPESDIAACESIVKRLAEYHDRIAVAPAFRDPRHAKWLISRCQWFCGTRMHATIAGLSSGVPTASIAYSLKTRGVFATCNVADAVADPRTSDTSEVVDTILAAWRARQDYKSRLEESLPRVLARAQAQADRVMDTARSLAAQRETVAT